MLIACQEPFINKKFFSTPMTYRNII